VAVFLFLSSCVRQSIVRKNSLVELNSTSVFIQMPSNLLVFENISPLVYKIFWDHFDRVGYNLSKMNNTDFVLKIEIKDLGSARKIVSPDILSYGYNVKFELVCSLCDKNDKLLKKETFNFSTVIFKPRNPILSSNFLDFGYKKLIGRAAFKVEQYFRPYFLKKVNIR